MSASTSQIYRSYRHLTFPVLRFSQIGLDCVDGAVSTDFGSEDVDDACVA